MHGQLCSSQRGITIPISQNKLQFLQVKNLAFLPVKLCVHTGTALAYFSCQCLQTVSRLIRVKKDLYSFKRHQACLKSHSQSINYLYSGKPAISIKMSSELKLEDLPWDLPFFFLLTSKLKPYEKDNLPVIYGQELYVRGVYACIYFSCS